MKSLLRLLALSALLSLQQSLTSAPLPPNFPTAIEVITPSDQPLDEAAILADIPNYKIGGDRTALLALRTLAASTGNSTALAAKLAKITTGSSTTHDAKVALLETIGLLRANEQVPFLETFLLNPDLAFAAGGALQQIATPEAKAALARALTKADDSQSLQLLTTAASLPDQSYLPSIQKFLASQNPATQLAALRAFAAVPAPEILSQLLALRDKLPSTLSTDYAIQLLKVTQSRQASAADRDAALKQLLASNFPQIRRAAYLEQLQDAPPAQITQLLLSKDPAQQAAALAILSNNPKKLPPALLALLLPKLDNDALQQLLAATKSAATPELLPSLQKLLSNKNPIIAQQAAEAIGNIATPEALDTLLKQAGTSTNTDQLAQLNSSLNNIPASLAPKFRAALNSPSPAVQQIAITQLTRLGDTTIVPALLEKLPSADRTLSSQLLAAIGELATANQIPDLLNLFSTKTNSSPERIRAAILRIAARQPAETQSLLEKTFAGTSTAAQLQIIELYAALQTPASLNQLTQLLNSSDADQRKAAIRAIASSKSPDSLQPLLNFAKSSATQPNEQILALRSLAQLLERLDLPESQRTQLTQAALALCTRNEEKQLFAPKKPTTQKSTSNE